MSAAQHRLQLTGLLGAQIGESYYTWHMKGNRTVQNRWAASEPTVTAAGRPKRPRPGGAAANSWVSPRCSVWRLTAAPVGSLRGRGAAGFRGRGRPTCGTFYVGAFVKSWMEGAKGRATLAGTLGRTHRMRQKRQTNRRPVWLPAFPIPGLIRPGPTGGARSVGHGVSRTAFYPC